MSARKTDKSAKENTQSRRYTPKSAVSSATLLAWEQVSGRAVMPMDRIIAERASSLFSLSGRRSRSLPDCLIAATAIGAAARLATLNPGDFEPLTSHGLVLV